ncbi:hypothetical protein HDZ31DRAFT_69644 [Schizophyllum fasciatum]
MAPLILCDACQTSLPSNDYLDNFEKIENLSSLPTYLRNRASAEQHLADVQRTYLQYDEQRRKAVILVHKLEREIEALQAHMLRVRAAHAPHQRLIPDVLQRIFAFAVADREYALRDLSSTPITLGQVCSLWRSVVRSSPRLWASLDIRRPIGRLDHGSLRERLQRAVQHHRLQSTPFPLKLRIGAHADHVSTVWQLLRDSERWQDCYTENTDVVLKMSEPDFNLRALVSLHVPVVLTRPLRLENVPALREYQGPRTNAFVPWAQLTSVAVVTCTSATSFTAQRLNVHGGDAITEDSEMLHLPNLCHLGLQPSEQAKSLAEHIFPRLTVPNLTSLEIGFSKATSPLPWQSKTGSQALANCLARSHASLTALTLAHVDIKVTETKALLSALPGLSRLRVVDAGGEKSTTNFALKALTPTTRSARGGLCAPALRALELQTRFGLDLELLLRLVRARSVWNEGSLVSLTLCLVSDDYVADWARESLTDLLPSIYLKFSTTGKDL